MSAASETLLPDSLSVAVPIEMALIGQMDQEQRDWLRGQLGPLLQAGADDMLYGGGRAHPAFAAYARALALCSFQPGGVTAFGLHWCQDHSACLRAQRAADEAWRDGEPG